MCLPFVQGAIDLIFSCDKLEMTQHLAELSAGVTTKFLTMDCWTFVHTSGNTTALKGKFSA